MELKYRVIEQRIKTIQQLSPAEQVEAKADEEVLALIAENLRLSPVREKFGTAPDKGAMLEQVYRQALTIKENPMQMISRLFTGRSVVARAALALSLLLLVAAGSVLMLPRGTSWAAVDGYVLVFDFGQVGSGTDKESDQTQFQSRVDLLNSAIHAWADQRREAAGDKTEEKEHQLFLNVEIEDGDLQVVVGFVDGTADLLEDLKKALAKNGDLPVPTVTESTWFTDKYGDPCGPGGVVVNIFNHQFTLPPGTDSQTAETQINAWLAENKPELKAAVEITYDGENTQVRIRLIEEE